MVRFINHITGTEMWVAENRVEEYKAAGFRLAAAPVIQEPEKPIVEEPEKPIKKTAANKKK